MSEDTVPAVQVQSPKRGAALVPIVSLPVELGIAGLGGVIAGLGTFVGTSAVTNIASWEAFRASAIGAGFTALTFFTNSLKNWYQQRYGGIG
jgi:hypothetical protein